MKYEIGEVLLLRRDKLPQFYKKLLEGFNYERFGLFYEVVPKYFNERYKEFTLCSLQPPRHAVLTVLSEEGVDNCFQKLDWKLPESIRKK